MADDLTAAWEALSGRLRTRTKEPVRPQPRGAAPPQVSAATPAAAAPSGSSPGSGSIASPLTEVSREYWPSGWQTSDGMFVFPAIKKLTMTDADGATVEFNFLEPDS